MITQGQNVASTQQPMAPQVTVFVICNPSVLGAGFCKIEVASGRNRQPAPQLLGTAGFQLALCGRDARGPRGCSSWRCRSVRRRRSSLHGPKQRTQAKCAVAWRLHQDVTPKPPPQRRPLMPLMSNAHDLSVQAWKMRTSQAARGTADRPCAGSERIENRLIGPAATSDSGSLASHAACFSGSASLIARM